MASKAGAQRRSTFETDNWPFVKASQYRKWTGPPTRRPVRLIVIHDMEFPETPNAAEVIAHDFATRTAKNPGSAHINVDDDSIVQCVKDNDIAFGAPGANRDGIQIELAGFGKQTRAEWLDAYSEALLEKGADATAQYCLKYSIPAVHLTNTQLAQGAKGIIGHYQASAVYHLSDHTDPGTGFPWDYFIALVGRAIERRTLHEAGEIRSARRTTTVVRCDQQRDRPSRDLELLPLEPGPRHHQGRVRKNPGKRPAPAVRAAGRTRTNVSRRAKY